MKRNHWIVIVVSLLLAGLLAGLVARVLVTQRGDSQAEGPLAASGTIEVTEVRIGFRLPGTLTQRPVNEGESVAAGTLIATLDSRELHARLREAEAGTRVAQAALAELESGFRTEEVAQAEAAVREAAVQAQNLEAQAARSRALFAEGGISQEHLDRDLAAASGAEARHQSARERWQLLRRGPREEQIAAARARLEQTEAAVETLRITLSEMSAHSPIPGVVTRVHAEVGETLAALRPVATLADLSRPRLRVYIPERRIGEVRLGAPAEVAVDGWPARRFPGHVSFVSSQAEFTPKNVQTLEERVKLVFAVDVQLENSEGILKPGMPADVWIDVDTPRQQEEKS
ncbi:MAG: efflux RND transporter periplasmic adaptor subunit [Gammaproteobacteria bacterium]|nr:efflux RND transporter periplasmic adaptor subunit [Gammaproteobacteria bacterium]